MAQSTQTRESCKDLIELSKDLNCDIAVAFAHSGGGAIREAHAARRDHRHSRVASC